MEDEPVKEPVQAEEERAAMEKIQGMVQETVLHHRQILVNSKTIYICKDRMQNAKMIIMAYSV